MGELFTTFDEAWSSFLDRDEPLESFFDQFPDDPGYVAEGWLIVPPTDVKREALRLQSVLEEVDGLVPVPHHFLHVWLSGAGAQGPDLETLLDQAPLELQYARLNCFHTAVVAEVSGLPIAGAAPTYLPHLTLAVVKESADPRAVRDVVVPRRNTVLGSSTVTQLHRCSFPCGRTTVLEPWTVVERARVRR